MINHFSKLWSFPMVSIISYISINKGNSDELVKEVHVCSIKGLNQLATSTMTSHGKYDNQAMSMLALLLVFLQAVTVSSEVYHIKPSLNDQCPNEPCSTFSQFAAAANSNNYIKSNTSLVFLLGNHSLNLKLLVNDVIFFGLYAFQTGYSTNIRIECMLPGNISLMFHNLVYVDVQGIEFVGCANTFSSIGQLMVVDTTFSFKKEDHQTAIRVVETSASIANSLFRHNVGSRYQEIVSDSEEGYKMGGAIAVMRSTVTITNSTFEGNSAERGGAIYAEQDSNVTIANSTFVKNAVKCNSSESLRNYSCYGGVLYSHNCTINVCYSTFHNNSAEGADSHGGVFGLFDSIVSIYQNVFLHSRATWNGGVILIWKSNITSARNTFNKSNANQGGVLYAFEADFVDEKSVFCGNRVNNNGAVTHSYFGSVTVIESELCYNTARGRGGVVFMRKGRVAFTGSKLLENYAFGSGGVLFGKEVINMSVHSSEYYGNGAGDTDLHGDIIDLLNPVEVFICRSNFTANGALQEGGVLHVTNFNAEFYLIIISCEFIDNIGGVMIIDQHQPTDTHSAIYLRNNQFIHNTAEYSNGGVIVGQHNNITVNSCEFVGNVGTQGGVIQMEKSHIEVYNSKFHTNAALQGGVMHIEKSHIVVSESTFHNNAALQGGVLYADSTHITVTNSTFGNNSASKAEVTYIMKMQKFMRYGYNLPYMANLGVIYLIESTAVFSGYTEFKENKGSLVVYGSILNITNYSQFINCSAPNSSRTVFQEGGALTAFQSELFFHGNCTFIQNSAEHGGAIHSIESKINVYGEMTIDRNRATQTGGGIFIHQSEFNCESHGTVRLLCNTAL